MIHERKLTVPKFICLFACALLVPGCKTEAARSWELVDPGGGGAATAMYRVPNSSHLFVSSNVGGFRYSPNAGERFRVINEGLDFTLNGGDNIQRIVGYRLGDTDHIVGSATGGVLYWRSIGPEGLDSSWKIFFDVRQSDQRRAPTFGALAVDPEQRRLYTGIGNPNNLSFKELTRLHPKFSGQLFIFDIKDSTSGPMPPSPAGEISLTAACDGVKGGPYFHISDLDAVRIDGVEHLYVATTEGLLVVKEPGTNGMVCSKLTVAKQNPFVLAVRADDENPEDVVLLLNEGPLEKKNNREGDNNWSRLKGGLFHTRSLLSSSPDWNNITPPQAKNKALGRLERSRVRPAELVLAGDADSDMGVLYTPDFATGTWRIVLDRSFLRQDRRKVGADGWRRIDNRFTGIKGTAIDEDDKGISTIYISGFHGRILTGVRQDGDFRFEQMYTTIDDSRSPVRYRNRGLPLMNPWRAYVDPRNAEQVVFLYHDNLMFVSDDAGTSFRRPVKRFGWGLDTLFAPDGNRVFVAYVRGQHLDSGWRKTAELGGILSGSHSAQEWEDISPAIPGNGAIESLSFINGDLCANSYRTGVYCMPVDRTSGWRRQTPESLEIVQLLDVDDDGEFWVVAAKGGARDICRISSGDPLCSALPAKAPQFERLWYDEGRLWVGTKSGSTYSSTMQSDPQWERVDGPVADLRTISLGQQRIALIASGTDGLFASRTPLERSSWCQLPYDGLDGNRVITSISSPANGDYLFVAISGVGFYRNLIENIGRDIAENCPDLRH